MPCKRNSPGNPCCNKCKFKCTGTQQWDGVETQGMGSEGSCSCPEDAIWLFPSPDSPTNVADPTWTDVLDNSAEQWCQKLTDAGTTSIECILHDLDSGCIVESETITADVDWYNGGPLESESILVQYARRYKFKLTIRTWNGANTSSVPPTYFANGKWQVTAKYEKSTGKSYIKVQMPRVLELEWTITEQKRVAFSALSPGGTDLDLFFSGGHYYCHLINFANGCAWDYYQVAPKVTLSTSSCESGGLFGEVGFKITKDQSAEAEWEIIDCDDAIVWHSLSLIGDAVSKNFAGYFSPQFIGGTSRSPSDIWPGVDNSYVHPCQTGAPEVRIFKDGAPPPPPPPDPP